MKLLRTAFIPIVLALLYFASCSDDNTTNTGIYHVIDPTILQTDQFGNILGGDTTDWCFNGGNGVSFNPSYPNPTNDTLRLHFVIAQPDTLTLYFLDSSTDTAFLMNNHPVQNGFYELEISSKALGYNNVIKRLYLKVKNHPNNSPYCRYYGDVQFF